MYRVQKLIKTTTVKLCLPPTPALSSSSWAPSLLLLEDFFLRYFQRYLKPCLHISLLTTASPAPRKWWHILHHSVLCFLSAPCYPYTLKVIVNGNMQIALLNGCILFHCTALASSLSWSSRWAPGMFLFFSSDRATVNSLDKFSWARLRGKHGQIPRSGITGSCDIFSLKSFDSSCQIAHWDNGTNLPPVLKWGGCCLPSP